MAGPILIDSKVMELAGPHGGICRRSDLLESGVSGTSIDRRVRVGLLAPVARGVYLVPELANLLTPYFRAVVTIPNAVLSHHTAGELHGFPVEADTASVHVIVASGRNHSMAGVRHHQSRTLHPHDVETVGSLPITSPARTVVDLAAFVGPARLRHVVQTQVRDNRPNEQELLACFDATARRGVTGAALLRRTLRELFHDRPFTQSALEDQVRRLFDDYRIVGFESQFRPPWYDGRHGIVDFADPSLRVILEADGRRWHQRDQEMTADRQRDRQAASYGWVTIRITWSEVNSRPAATAREIESIMDAQLLSIGAA